MPRVLLGTLTVVSACTLLLGGAWFAARALTADSPAPAPLANPPALVAGPATDRTAPVPARPLPTPPSTPPPIPAPPPAPTIPLAHHERDLVPESDFAAEDAPAIAQAWKELGGEDVAGWRAAQRIFRRCLVQVPRSQRCEQGLAAAQAKLGEAAARPVRRSARRLAAPFPDDEEAN